jgi:hypothetical protein
VLVRGGQCWKGVDSRRERCSLAVRALRACRLFTAPGVVVRSPGPSV